MRYDISRLAKLIVLSFEYNVDAASLYRMLNDYDEFVKRRLFQRPFV